MSRLATTSVSNPIRTKMLFFDSKQCVVHYRCFQYFWTPALSRYTTAQNVLLQTFIRDLVTNGIRACNSFL